MVKINEYLKREFTSWKLWQVAWMMFANAVIISISVYQGDSILGIAASVTGVICVILCGLGKVSNYIFGTINVILYAIAAYQAKYYGDVMLNLMYYLPTNIIGWICWEKNIDVASNTVVKKRMTIQQDIVVGMICIVAVFAYSYILRLLGGNLPLIDSMSTVFSVVAQVLMIKRYAEQWVVWIVVDVASVAMWFVALSNEGASIAVLLMWMVFLVNAVIMFVKWLKESKDDKKVVL